MDYVVKLVVMEYRKELECVTTPYVHVEGSNVKVLTMILFLAMMFVVQVRCNYECFSIDCLSNISKNHYFVTIIIIIVL